MILVWWSICSWYMYWPHYCMCIINLLCTYFILNFKCNGSGPGSRINRQGQGRRCDVARVVTLCDWYASLYTSLPCHRVQFDKSGRGCHYLQVWFSAFSLLFFADVAWWWRRWSHYLGVVLAVVDSYALVDAEIDSVNTSTDSQTRPVDWSENRCCPAL